LVTVELEQVQAFLTDNVYPQGKGVAIGAKSSFFALTFFFLERTVHIRVTFLCLAKPIGLVTFGLAMRKFQLAWMEIFFQPLETGFTIHQFCDWKIHATYLT
jgi:hypothetical protein